LTVFALPVRVTLSSGMGRTFMEFRVLGPVEVVEDSRPRQLPAGRVRALLVILLLRANKVVTVDEVVGYLWGESPPERPRAAVHTCVQRVRRALGRDLIHTTPRGYLLEIDPDSLDLTVFRRLVENASGTEDLTLRAELFGRALDLWRGLPLVDLNAESLVREVAPQLAEERLRAIEGGMDARLRLGQHEELVAELVALTAEHPLREPFWSLLMLALYNCGRQAEALEAYRVVAAKLADELGIDPGADLRRLHQAVLTADPQLIVTPPAVKAKPPVKRVPRQLPPDVRGFTGRAGDLARLDALLAEYNQDGTRPIVIAVVAGTAGVGKTALAVHWAQHVADRFPDGQLWVNLNGYGPTEPAKPEQALTILLRTLGVPSLDIPVELDAQSGIFRTLLAGKRMLLVLDNANDPDQVRPLLPGAPGCLVVVTSRDDLSGLVVREGATRIRLGLMSHQESVALLRRLLGTGRADTDASAVEDLASLCARLPLALRIAGDRADSDSGPLRAVIEELASEHRLDKFTAGNDPRATVRSVLSWSYQALPAGAASLFRRLGLVPGADWDEYAAAALADRPVQETRHLLDALTSAHLVDEHAGRYQMHDLLRDYAAEHAEADDSEAGRIAAYTRLLDYYLGTAALAADILFPFDRDRRPTVATPATPVPPLPDADRATSWLDTERANLTAVVTRAASGGWPEHAIRAATVLFRYLLNGAHHAEALRIHQHALAAAIQLADRPAQATALQNLGTVHVEVGHGTEALDHYQRALAIRREIGDRAGEASALGNLGHVYFNRAQYSEAAEFCRQVLAVRRELGDRVGQATTLGNLGTVYLKWGRYPEASECSREALKLSREVGNRSNEASRLDDLGLISLQVGDHAQAARYCQMSLVIHRETGYLSGQAHNLVSLGLIHLKWGQLGPASAYYREALAIATRIELRSIETSSLNGLGAVACAAGQPDEAMAHHQAALSLATEIGERYEQACALEGIGQVHRDAGDGASAQRYWRDALALYRELDVPEANKIRHRLSVQVTGRP
jgi:DNA-binding SARP family transcriptional activator/Tfp pilus assembly protein PilF